MFRVTLEKMPDQFKSDERGWAFFPFQKPGARLPVIDAWSIHTVRSEPGAVRGNHYHPSADEWLQVFGGPWTLYWEEDGRVRSEIVDGDDVLVHIPAGTSHAVVNTSDGPIFLFALREKAGEADVSLPRPIV